MGTTYYTTKELAALCHVSPTTIFRAIIQKQLTAATTPGGHFRIPAKEAERFLLEHKMALPSTKSDIKRILIVEDNPAELRFFVRALQSIPHYEVKSTHSGYEAGLLTQSFKPDLILMDIFLKDSDGRQVTKLIHSDPHLKSIKILAITGTKSQKELNDIKNSGFDFLIQKPVTIKDLRKTIEEVLK